MGDVYIDSIKVGTFEPQTVGTSGDVYVDTVDVGDFDPLEPSGYVYIDTTQVGTYTAIKIPTTLTLQITPL